MLSMTTNAEAVSKVINSLRGINSDNRIPRRYVLKLLRDASKVLISQKNLDRTISLESNLFSEVNCFEFQKVEVIRCPISEFRTCKQLMKSKKPLPELVFSRLGSSIKDVTSIDGEIELEIVDLNQYRRNKKRQYNIKNKAYVYVDSQNYMYIPDLEILALNIRILTLETDLIEGCDKDNCKTGWDYNFIVPDKLTDTVFKEVLTILTSTYKNIRQDQNPNGIEGQ